MVGLSSYVRVCMDRRWGRYADGWLFYHTAKLINKSGDANHADDGECRNHQHHGALRNLACSLGLLWHSISNVWVSVPTPRLSGETFEFCSILHTWILRLLWLWCTLTLTRQAMPYLPLHLFIQLKISGWEVRWLILDLPDVPATLTKENLQTSQYFLYQSHSVISCRCR